MFFLGGEGPRGGSQLRPPSAAPEREVESARIRSPFAGSLRNPRKGNESEPIRPGAKNMANVAPERGPFLEGNLGGTKRHATVRDDLFRRESPPKVVHERGATFAHVFGSGKREEIAPLSLLSLLSLSSLSSVSSLSSLRSN